MCWFRCWTSCEGPEGSRIVTRDSEAGLELRAAGVINNEKYFSDYQLEADPEQAEIDALAQQLEDLVMTGNTDNVQPGSLLFDLYQAVRGRISMEMLNRSPNFVLAQAEQMAAQAQAAAENIATPQVRGNPAGAAGVVQPGLGMPLQQAGTPNTQAPV